jgi:glycogen operon protein
MGLGITTNDDARARLNALVDASTRRPLPAHVVTQAGEATAVPLFLAAPPRIGGVALRLRAASGFEQVLAYPVDGLPAQVDIAQDGQPVHRKVVTLPAMAAGYYDLSIEGVPECASAVVVAPQRCYLPRELAEGARRFGLAAHLYALRRAGDQGIGDFTTLARIGAATARAGGSVVAINPLHALFAEDRDRASPYHPSDRRYLDPIYVDLDAVPDLAEASAAQAILTRERQRIRALAAAREVDYPAVWQVKRDVLAQCFARFCQRDAADPLIVDFERFVAASGPALVRFATFQAIAGTRPREPWQHWPADLRRPDAAGVEAFARRHANDVRFALFLQWLADRQLAAAAHHAKSAGLAFGFLRDLAIGAAPDGAETWAGAASIAQGVAIGAPPDSFSPAGQNWNLPPPNPHAQAASGAADFRNLLAENMRHAGALRIDHVMGLARLFWIPDGATPDEGSYVRYPLDLLLGVLALESARHRCLVIGEDLGTVPEGFRERLGAADVLSYRVLWFEREGREFLAPARYPVKAAACVSTHDLPTVAGWWDGGDIDERHALGLLTDAEAAAAREERGIARGELVRAYVRTGVDRGAGSHGDAPHTPAVTAAVHRYAGASRSAMVLLQADDIAGETTALNLPGTDRERPNWRRKVGLPVEALWTSPIGQQAAADLASERGAPAVDAR